MLENDFNMCQEKNDTNPVYMSHNGKIRSANFRKKIR